MIIKRRRPKNFEVRKDSKTVQLIQARTSQSCCREAGDEVARMLDLKKALIQELRREVEGSGILE